MRNCLLLTSNDLIAPDPFTQMRGSPYNIPLVLQFSQWQPFVTGHFQRAVAIPTKGRTQLISYANFSEMRQVQLRHQKGRLDAILALVFPRPRRAALSPAASEYLFAQRSLVSSAFHAFTSPC